MELYLKFIKDFGHQLLAIYNITDLNIELIEEKKYEDVVVYTFQVHCTACGKGNTIHYTYSVHKHELERWYFYTLERFVKRFGDGLYQILFGKD